jgi:hypothetical protein
MIITCKTHGEVEAPVDRDYNVWCPQCWDEAVKRLSDSSRAPVTTKPTALSIGLMTTAPEGSHPLYPQTYTRKLR